MVRQEIELIEDFGFLVLRLKSLIEVDLHSAFITTRLAHLSLRVHSTHDCHTSSFNITETSSCLIEQNVWYQGSLII